MYSWWETPLCTKFLKGIVDEIDNGKIALVFLPKHVPGNFLSQLKATFDQNSQVLFEKLNLLDCDKNEPKPIESLLYSHFDIVNNSDTFVPKNVVGIFKHLEPKPDQIYVFDNLSNSLLDKFREFIIDFGRYSASLPVFNRHKVIVVLKAENFDLNDFANESGMYKVLFQGVFDKLDYALGLRYFHNYQANKNNFLFENMIASLSVFDIQLVEELLECNNLIEDYPELLVNYAKEREWENIKFIGEDKLTDTEIWQRWSNGVLEIKNDKKIYHSAFLKIHNQDAELIKRIWLSGVEILTPLIEDFRGKLLKCNKLKYPLRFPNTKTDEIKENKMDLEIGEICYFVNKYEIKLIYFSISEKERLKGFINLCREIRNDLSHLRMPIASDILLFFKEYNYIETLLENND